MWTIHDCHCTVRKGWFLLKVVFLGYRQTMQSVGKNFLSRSKTLGLLFKLTDVSSTTSQNHFSHCCRKKSQAYRIQRMTCLCPHRLLEPDTSAAAVSCPAFVKLLTTFWTPSSAVKLQGVTPSPSLALFKVLHMSPQTRAPKSGHHEQQPLAYWSRLHMGYGISLAPKSNLKNI